MAFITNQIDYKNLKRMKIVDAEQKDVGKIIDFVVDENYRLTKFVLGGGRIEEFRERIGLKADDDPVVTMENISRDSLVSEGILKLNIKSSELINKLEADAFSEKEKLFSTLSTFSVRCPDDSHVGRVVDAIVYKDKSIDLILGDSMLVEFFEKIGLAKDYDLLLPTKFIEKEGDKVLTISKSKSELALLLKNQKVTDFVSQDKLHKANLDHKIMQFTRNY